MTVFLKRLLFNAVCDWCGNWCLADEIAYYNPKTKKVYHEYCLESAEIG